MKINKNLNCPDKNQIYINQMYHIHCFNQNLLNKNKLQTTVYYFCLVQKIIKKHQIFDIGSLVAFLWGKKLA